MSSCSQIFSAEALLRSVHEMAEVLRNFTIFEGGCGRPKQERVPDGGTNHPRDLEEGGSFIACKFARTLSAATIGARRLDGPAALKFDGLNSRMEFTPMLFQAGIACLIVLSLGILIAHAIDAFRT